MTEAAQARAKARARARAAEAMKARAAEGSLSKPDDLSWATFLERGLDEGARDAPLTEPTSADAVPSWPVSANGSNPASLFSSSQLESDLSQLRDEAMRVGRADAEAGVPGTSSRGPSESEKQLRERCLATFERWQSNERRKLKAAAAGIEELVSEKLGRTALAIDSFERVTNELCRLKARLALRRREVSDELSAERQERPRGLPTRVYLMALTFLGLVEFFANAPVFSALLPRDPLTERQIRLLAETSTGWLAGGERVLAHLLLRPDATLLAAGVVTFLCVLAHFFGHSLRELVMQRDRRSNQRTISGRSPMENVVPMLLSGLGLVLVVSVLFEARITLGEVGESRYQQDMAIVTELRRNAGWLRVNGDLLAANDATNRADDTEAAATELREYSASMSRLSFPILLLNLTLVLCAISAAYFHRRDSRREHFNESPFDEQRRDLVAAAEGMTREVSQLLSELVRHIRDLRDLIAEHPLADWRSVVLDLEAVITLYRAENGRVRELDGRAIAAFAGGPELAIDTDRLNATALTIADPDGSDSEREGLKLRFEEIRQRFNEEATAW